MDLANLDTMRAATDGVEMSVRHPVTGEPLADDNGKPMTITLIGSDSAQCRRIVKEIDDKRLRDVASGLRPSSQDEDREINTIVACTVAWSGILVDGSAPPYSPANVRMVYTRFAWIREQAAAFVLNRANFLPASSSVS